MRTRLAPLPIAALALLLTVPAAHAQDVPAAVAEWLADCRDGRTGWSSRGAHHCELRTLALPPGTRALELDGRQNGSVRVHGWDRDSVAIFAMVQIHDEAGMDEARRTAGAIRVRTDGGRIRAEADRDASRGRAGWSVSYHVLAPRRIDVDAGTHNGGISLEGIRGRLVVTAHNGGLSLRDVGGDVRGSTTNGGVRLALSGARWDGAGVDLETTNGGVSLLLPEGFNGRLETGTVNGSVSTDFPITLQGRIGRTLSTTLGTGGPLIRATTRNGGVKLERR